MKRQKTKTTFEGRKMRQNKKTIFETIILGGQTKRQTKRQISEVEKQRQIKRQFSRQLFLGDKPKDNVLDNSGVLAKPMIKGELPQSELNSMFEQRPMEQILI